MEDNRINGNEHLESKRISRLEQEIELEQKEINLLKEELDEIKREEEHEHKEHVNLIFIVNGEPVEIRSSIHWELKIAVEKALKETGNEGRPFSDWVTKWNDKTLPIAERIEQFHFPNCAELFVSLNAGQGGE